jgi:hypothetical protein
MLESESQIRQPWHYSMLEICSDFSLKLSGALQAVNSQLQHVLEDTYSNSNAATKT